jgi:proline iminopeptidase
MTAKLLPAVVALVVFSCNSSVVAAEQSAPKPHNRAEATAPRGIEDVRKVRIGGIDQWITVRGKDRRNPILLYLHGGPGFTMMPISWHFQSGWEDYFTVVQWDQRGSGRTYTENDPKLVEPTLNHERYVADTEEFIQWLQREYGKNKIFLVGHSWGSSLGLTIARKHPEWLYAYVGIGQVTNSRESERRGWQFAMDEARRANNAEAVRELQGIAGYGKPGHPIVLKDLYVQRKWLGFFGGAVFGRHDYDTEVGAVRLSPDYTDADVASFGKGNDFTQTRLLAALLETDLSTITRLDCPLIIFAGRHDHNVSSEVAAEWFAQVRAPSKQLVWFENSAHVPPTEEPGKTLVSLVRYARPFAERAGDAAPM